MTRLAFFTALALAMLQAQTAPTLAQDGCTSAFLDEHLGRKDGATMLRLWGTTSADPDRTGSLAPDSTQESPHVRVVSKFLEVWTQYQVRCPDQNLPFE
jgi:hypothetical protein